MSKTAESNNESRVYEIGYLVLPSIPEDKLSGVVDKIKGAVEQAGGKTLDGEEPFKQDLAYTMTKVVGASRYVVSDAYVGWMKFELEGSKAPEVKASLDKIDELLRFLLIKAPRESVFTFEKAREALMEKMAKENEAKEDKGEEEVVPVEVVE
jgi:ribosomal protein S6